jgi:hypothetical protein
LNIGEPANHQVNVRDIIIALASLKLECLSKGMLVESLDEDAGSNIA